MTLRKTSTRGVFEIECDECGETDTADGITRGEAYADLKDQGWRAVNDGGTWIHKCSECVADWAWGNDE